MTADVPTFGLPMPDAIAREAVERRFEPEQDLFLEGDAACELYGVVNGRVKLWRTLEDGSAWTVLILGPGELLGSVAVAQAGPQLISATALDHVVAATWSAPSLRAELRGSPDLADAFLRLVARRVDQLMERFGDVAGLSVEKRLARVLLRLLAGASDDDGGLAAVVEVRQREMAEMALTTVPTVSRTLSNWSRADVVRVERGRVAIPRLSRLASIAGVELD